MKIWRILKKGGEISSEGISLQIKSSLFKHFQNISARIASISHVFVLVIIVHGFANAQQISLSGKISSEKNEPLENANILAFPQNKDLKTVFSISNQRGRYQLSLKKGEDYLIRISYIGFEEYVFEHNALQDENIDFVLISQVTSLDEVVLEYKLPIIVKEDTITYQADAFVDGNERKLREVLKKLPGIEVDRDGNVKALGKDVTKVLVEDKIFFTGNSKLAVNNIPADAVDQVQILENYNKIGFLKGLQDSDEIALNINLKEEKKKFAFGDLELGGGPEEYYLAHPVLFYYSPETTVNVIADINNIGYKSFEFGDYIEFNGGVGKLLSDFRGYSLLANDDFSRFLSNNDFRSNSNRFGALNIRRSVSKNTDINAYIIASDNNIETLVNSLNVYNNSNTAYNEIRENSEVKDNFFALGKITLEHKPNVYEDFAANTFVKFNRNNASGALFTQSFGLENSFSTNSNLNAAVINQNLEYSKRFSRAQTFSLELSLNVENSTPQNNWKSDQNFLDQFIPIIEDSQIDVIQEIENRTTSFNFIAKDYWILNNYNHIYTTVGTNLLFNSSTSEEIQRLSDGGINNFSANGFGNTIDYRFADTFLGLEYKFLSGIFSVKLGLFYHSYLWNNSQMEAKVSNATQVILPKFKAEVDFSKSEKLEFAYNPRLAFPQSRRLFNNLLLNTFNSVVIGNPNLQYDRFHSYRLNYFKYSLFRRLNLNTSIIYTHKTQSVKNRTILDGIEQLSITTMFNEPENLLIGELSFSRRKGNLNVSFEATGSYNEYFQLVDEDVSKNFVQSASLTPKIETYFDHFPNLKVGYSYEPSEYHTAAASFGFLNQEYFGELTHDFLRDFKLSADYRLINYKNKSQDISNTFDLANASLYYHQEDSPWGFEISSTNLFNTQIKRENYVSDFLIIDKTTFILPRVFLFKINYKF